MRILNQTDEVKNIFKKTRPLVYVIFFSFLALLARVFVLQVVRGDEFYGKSRDNFILSEKIFPARGEILFADGPVMASTESAFKISIVPLFFSKSDQMEEQVDRLSSLIELSKNEKKRLLSKLVSCSGRCKNIPILVKDEIPKKKILSYSGYLTNFTGTIISSSYRRVYPYGEATSHITGYVSKINQSELETYAGYDPEDFTGKTGLEKWYENELHGEYGETFHVIDHVGRKIELPENIAGAIPETKHAVKGDSVRTAVLSYLQETAASALGELSGAVVVMEVKTGRVLALYSGPSYDSNLLSKKRIPEKVWREYSQSILHPLLNKVIRQTYFPGSTFKIIPAVTGLHYSLITPKSTYLCSGCLSFGRDTKCCWNRGGHGFMNLHGSLKASCDIYYYYLSQELGIDRMTRFASLFGVGTATGIDLPGEENGILPTRSWFAVNYPGMRINNGMIMNMSIGQGDIRMTPLQLAVVYAAFANGGIIVKPKIVDEIIHEDGSVTEIENEVVRVLNIKQSHFNEVNKSLWAVTNESGGTAFHHADHTIPDAAGKTGTSQVISNAERRNIDHTEDERKFLTQDDALFAAFFPYKNPEIVAVAVVESGAHGGSTAAPIVYKMLKSYYLKTKVIE
ncbi:penicillin-binding protein 2 [bacterium]|nr:penicillin-binding protein 2 [bacterium]